MIKPELWGVLFSYLLRFWIRVLSRVLKCTWTSDLDFRIPEKRVFKNYFVKRSFWDFFDVEKQMQTKPDSWKPLLRHPEDNLKMQFSVKNRGENKTFYFWSKIPVFEKASQQGLVWARVGVFTRKKCRNLFFAAINPMPKTGKVARLWSHIIDRLRNKESLLTFGNSAVNHPSQKAAKARWHYNPLVELWCATARFTHFKAARPSRFSASGLYRLETGFCTFLGQKPLHWPTLNPVVRPLVDHADALKNRA